MVKNKTQEKVKTLEAQATNLTDLIDYQKDSVVSRTIIDKKAGTVTLVRLRRKPRTKRTHGTL